MITALPARFFWQVQDHWPMACGSNAAAQVLAIMDFLSHRDPGRTVYPPRVEMSARLMFDTRTVAAAFRNLVERGFLRPAGACYRNVQPYTVHPPAAAELTATPAKCQGSQPVENARLKPGPLQGSEPQPLQTARVQPCKTPGLSDRYKELRIDSECDSESITPPERAIDWERPSESPEPEPAPHPISAFSTQRKITPTKAETEAARKYGPEVWRAVAGKLYKFERYRDSVHPVTGEAVAGGPVKVDDALIAKLLAAANGAEPWAVTEWLADRWEYAYRRPDLGPQGPGWFVEVVRQHFASVPGRVPPGHAEESGRAAAQTARVAVNGPPAVPRGLPAAPDPQFGADLIADLARKVRSF